MRGCLTGADHSAGFLSCRWIGVWPGMDDVQNDMPDRADGLPSVRVRVWVLTSDSQTIVKHQPRGFKAQPVVPFVGAILIVGPNPIHMTGLPSVTTLM